MTNKPTEAVIEAIRGALSWIEMPFVTAETPADELRNRISFCLADAERAIEALLASTPQKPDHLRTVFGAALTLCHNATDECRPDQQVLVPGDDLQALNDALDVVEEADADREKATPQEPDDDAEWKAALQIMTVGWHEARTSGPIDRLALVKAIVAAAPTRLQAKAPETAWQPIETAPREEFMHTVLIARDHGKRCVMPAFFDGEEWQSVSIVGALAFVDPTHWQPLPNPPYSGIVVVDEADFTRGEE